MAELRALSVVGFAVFCDLFHEDSNWNQFKRRMEYQTLSPPIKIVVASRTRRITFLPSRERLGKR